MILKSKETKENRIFLGEEERRRRRRRRRKKGPIESRVHELKIEPHYHGSILMFKVNFLSISKKKT